MIKLTLFNTLLLTGFIQGVFLVFALKKLTNRNKKANRYLICLISLISLALIGRISYSPEVLKINIQYAMLPDFILFLFGPILYAYVKSLLTESDTEPLSWIHFIPATLHFGVMTMLISIEKADYFLMATNGSLLYSWHSILSLSLIHIGLYYMSSLKIIVRYHKNLNDVISYDSKTKYLLTVMTFIGFCLMIWLISESITLFSWTKPDFGTYGYLWVVLTFLVYVLGYYTMNQPELFKIASRKEKYQGSRLSAEEVDNLKNKVKTYIEKETPFLNPKLSHKELAESLAINTSDLSRIINEAFGKNFSDFINGFRVETFINNVKSKKYENFTLLAIAKESGFNSKTTFNTAFKKHTGSTPKSYFQEIKN